MIYWTGTVNDPSRDVVRRTFTLYRSIFDVVRDFLHDEAVEEPDKVLTRYLKPDLLIIDDMGMKQLPKRSGEYPSVQRKEVTTVTSARAVFVGSRDRPASLPR
jgi:hypothetical protein